MVWRSGVDPPQARGLRSSCCSTRCTSGTPLERGPNAMRARAVLVVVEPRGPLTLNLCSRRLPLVVMTRRLSRAVEIQPSGERV
jgi:hypothetical protein